MNNDRTQTDQWQPAIAVKPGGTKLFIGYYTRQNDPNSNSLIMAYDAKGDVANGLSNATFECFPISTTAFPPLFNGTNDITNMQFDPLLPAATNYCFDVYGRICCVYPTPTNRPPPTPCPAGDSPVATGSGQANWFQDDNTWADADTNCFYYAWSDRSRTWTNSFSWTSGTTNASGGTVSWPMNISRPASDVKFAVIRQ